VWEDNVPLFGWGIKWSNAKIIKIKYVVVLIGHLLANQHNNQPEIRGKDRGVIEEGE
jgi:hypothetical protein